MEIMDTDKEVSIIVDKGDEDLTLARGCKRKMADGESADTWITKKSKVS